MRSGSLILAVETSGRWGSVALGIDDNILVERQFSAPMRHSAELFAAVNDLLCHCSRLPHEIAEIYISAGPGSFTGIRLAVAMAKTMAFANSVKVVAVNSLDVTAQNASQYAAVTNHKISDTAVALDAKRGQFFVGFFRYIDGFWQSDSTLQLMRPESFIAAAAARGAVWLLGEGLLYYRAKFESPHISILPEEYWQPSAAHVFILGRRRAKAGDFADPVSLVPIYIRAALDEDSPPKKKPL